ncbi:MAG TPA: hypothetical protein V6C65_24720 [Allocoleopsis sp.]
MRKICGRGGFVCGIVHDAPDDRLDEDNDFAVAIELCGSPQLKRRKELQEIIRVDSTNGGMDEMSNDPAQRYRDRQAEKLRLYVEECHSARMFAERLDSGEVARLDSESVKSLTPAQLSRLPLRELKRLGVIC